MKSALTRRQMIASGAALPLALDTPLHAAAPGDPPYTLSINIEIMFPRTMPRPDRIRAVANQGFKAYSFWNTSEQEQDAMLKVQQETGIKCASITGPGNSVSSTGLTRPGAQQTFLDEMAARAKMAKKFGGAQSIIFVGRVQQDVPWETQRAQIVAGLKQCGEIAKEQDMTFIVEPLSTNPGQVRMALDTAAAAFPVIEEVAHPNVKVCFDMYHLQLMEGNITTHLRQGISKGLIGLVQIGEVPGRKEPGTGEIDYAYMMRVLRELKWSGYVDTEMGTSTTPEAAMQLTRRMSLEN
ncbi:MAG TPA: TIM barrel protein [Bryobacteraceae bacterium]|nr:TIM barrel protein [Bryobacteraceae bacterium]